MHCISCMRRWGPVWRDRPVKGKTLLTSGLRDQTTGWKLGRVITKWSSTTFGAFCNRAAASPASNSEPTCPGPGSHGNMAGVEARPGTRMIAVARLWDKCVVAVHVHRCGEDAARHLRDVVGQVVKSVSTVQTYPRLTITDRVRLTSLPWQCH